MAVQSEQAMAVRRGANEVPGPGPVPTIDEWVAVQAAENGPPTPEQFEACARVVASWRAEQAEKQAEASRPRRRAA